MKVQAQSWVSDLQLGLPMPGADVPHLGAEQRLWRLFHGRKEGQPHSHMSCYLVGGLSWICKECARVHTDPHTHRFSLGVARIKANLGQHHPTKSGSGWAEVTTRIW